MAVAVALFAYGAGILIEKTADRPGRQQVAFWGACLCLVLCWTGFRYAGKLTGTSILFPLGISFYTFQALAYLTEVYWGEEKAERNVTDFLLYMLLFLKFLSGPIERPGNLLAQVKELRPATYPMMTYGAKLILVGLIKKLMMNGVMASVSDVIDYDTAALAATVADGPLAGLIECMGTGFGLILGMTGACALLLLISLVSSVSVSVL